jgi:hypothetical protein
MAAIMYVLAQRRFKIAYDWTPIGCCTVLAIGCVAAGYAVQPMGLWVRLTVYLAISLVYPLVVVLLLARSPSERERMRLVLEKGRYLVRERLLAWFRKDRAAVQ